MTENQEHMFGPNHSPLNDIDLLKSDYSFSEITLLYLRKRSPDGWNDRIIEVIEFLPKYLERGPDAAPRGQRLTGSSDYTFYLRRFHMTVEEGLNRYNRIRNGESVDIPKSEAEKVSHVNPTLLQNHQVGEEPPWPMLVCESENKYFWKNSSFWGFRPGGVRRHQLLVIERNIPLIPMLSTNEMKELRLLLQKTIPFELSDSPLLIGSCHLILPNPLFNDIQHRIDNSKPSKMHVYLKTYPSANISTLKAIFREFRPNDIAQSIEISPVDKVFSIDFGYEPHRVGFDIICSKRGVIFSSEPATFIRSIHINLGLISGTKKVFVPSNPPGGAHEQYSVPIVAHESTSIVGSISSLPTGTLHVLKDILDYKQRTKAVSEQRWFKDKEEAKKVVREMIGKAKTNIRIVDPYFGLREFQSYALATTSTNVVIEILSSVSFLKIKSNGLSIENGAELLKQIQSLNGQGVPKKIEIRVMPGRKPDIHDRFMKIDDQIWFLGSSLGEFGSRGTMMVRLQFPEPVGFEIEQIWNKSLTLGEFVANRSPEPE